MLFLHGNTLVLSEGWRIGLLAFSAVAVAGVLAGAFYRVGAAIALTFATAFSGIFLGVSNGWAFWQSILYALGLTTVLQLAYLLGVGIAVTVSRARATGSLRSFILNLFKQTAP